MDRSLVDRRCGACTASTPAATPAQIGAWLGELPGWAVIDGRLVRELRFDDFAGALAAANRAGAVAEAEGHHPDLAVGWGKLGISVFTHAIGALSEADFVLAAKIDRAVGA